MNRTVERCTGPNYDKRSWGLIPGDKRPIVSQDENGVNCLYFQADGTCSAMRSLLPEIVNRRVIRLQLIRGDFKSDKRTRREGANVDLRDTTSALSMAARMAENLPTCRLLEDIMIPS